MNDLFEIVFVNFTPDFKLTILFIKFICITGAKKFPSGRVNVKTLNFDWPARHACGQVVASDGIMN